MQSGAVNYTFNEAITFWLWRRIKAKAMKPKRNTFNEAITFWLWRRHGILSFLHFSSGSPNNTLSEDIIAFAP